MISPFTDEVIISLCTPAPHVITPFLYKSRRLERPKRKKRKHVVVLARFDCRTAEKIRDGEKLSNSELRKTLAQFGGDGNPDQEG